MRVRMAAAAAAVLICAVSLSSQAPPYDVLIRNGRVLDGSGNPWLAADLGIRGGRIVDMGRLGNAAAARVIDARGLTVSPGFIDVHSHASQGLEGSLKEARQLLAQGITTVAINPDGGGTVGPARRSARASSSAASASTSRCTCRTARSAAKCSAWPIARRTRRSSSA